tara:strand:- start:13485 stop:13697 length:213 start_codon:yes stop_codon:yes gene_type:complete
MMELEVCNLALSLYILWAVSKIYIRTNMIGQLSAVTLTQVSKAQATDYPDIPTEEEVLERIKNWESWDTE